jgi:hypothetical protein
MSAAFDKPLLVELVEHSNESDWFDVEPSRDLGLANPLVSGDV